MGRSGSRLDNNSGYSLLGYLAETIADKPFEALLHDEVLEPLGMKATGYLDVNLDSSGPIVSWNTTVNKTKVAYPPMPWAWMAVGHGGLWSSTEDLGRFMRALLKRPTEFLSKKAWALLLDQIVIGTEGTGSTDTWGYGFAHYKRGNANLIGHAGGYIGVRADMTLSPSDGVAVIALENCDWGSASALTQVVNKELLGISKVEYPTPDLSSLYGSKIRVFRSETLGLFNMKVTKGHLFAYLKNWDDMTEMLPSTSRTFFFQMSKAMSTALGAMSTDVPEDSESWASGTLFPAKNGKLYFVSRLGVGVPEAVH